MPPQHKPNLCGTVLHGDASLAVSLQRSSARQGSMAQLHAPYLHGTWDLHLGPAVTQLTLCPPVPQGVRLPGALHGRVQHEPPGPAETAWQILERAGDPPPLCTPQGVLRLRLGEPDGDCATERVRTEPSMPRENAEREKSQHPAETGARRGGRRHAPPRAQGSGPPHPQRSAFSLFKTRRKKNILKKK